MPQQLDASKYYAIRSTTGTRVVVRRGADAPNITGGGARYTIVQRPRRTSMIQWNGDDPYTMDLPILFDGWALGTYGTTSESVEQDIAAVNQMMHSQGELTPPVQVFIEGAVPVKGAKWVIQTITWGSVTIWDTDVKGKGYRLRQDAVIGLLQFFPETVLQFQRKPGTTTPYTVKTLDTLAAIAAKYGVLKSDIMKKNNIRDPKSIKVGQIILIPPAIFGPAFGTLPITGGSAHQQT